MAVRTAGRRAEGAKRPRFRREMIFTAAAELFRRQGYRGTRIEDIGAAVGMSGPAVYRHFASKEALLVELLERFVARAHADLHTALASEGTPRERMERIVRASVAHAVEESDLVALAEKEIAHLPPDARRRIGRRQGAIADAWADVLLALRPELAAEEARIVVIGVASMVAAASRVRSLPEAKCVDRITRMAMGALLAR